MPVLHLIEINVVEFSRASPELNNYSVMRAYEAAIDHFRALSKGATPKHSLTGVDAELFECVLEACKHGIDGGIDYAGKRSDPLEIDDIRSALGKLRRSVELWHQQGGRTAYLDFIERTIS